jgi:hypothetical protein
MQGISNTPAATHERTFEVNNSSTGNKVEDYFSYNTAAITVEEFEVYYMSRGNAVEDGFSCNTAPIQVWEFEIHERTSEVTNSSTGSLKGNDAEDDFSYNTAAPTVEASNVQVRTHVALGFLETGIPAHVPHPESSQLIFHTIILYSC